MKYNCIVIAGTKDSRDIIEQLKKEGKSILACVATDLGAEMLEQYDIDVHIGRLDFDGFVELFKDNPCEQIIDASHPFAKVVTETVKEAAKLLDISYERYERRNLTYDYDRIYSVADAKEAIDLLNSMEGNILLTTGVNTCHLYRQGVKDAEKRVYVRVLDNAASYAGCDKAGYAKDHVFGEMPPFTVEDNLRLIEKCGASVMVSKDSGATGGVDVKVNACKQAGIPMILIRRPEEIKKKTMPRIMFAGANSGCGKTSITCGVLKALTDRGLSVQPYKCGPDYIDPMLHGHITGKDCRNLDPFFSTGEDLRTLVAKDSENADLSVIEGVMGYYDGIGVSSEKSSHTVSVETETPVILIFNVKGMSHTMIPLIKGMIEYQTNPVKGVILNRCSKGMYQMMKEEIEKTLPVKVVGYFPVKEGIHIGSRHLGLMTAAEIDNLDEVLAVLGETARECIDLDTILDLAGQASPLSVVKKASLPKKRARIALAMDKAFCFYYKESLEVLEQLGAELIPFSPVNDEKLPENIGGIYLGGGYPETYAKKLAENTSMLASIRKAHADGKAIFAECGGFMYTCEYLVEVDGSSEPMLGLIPTDVQMTKKLSMQFGYVILEALEDTAYFKKGRKIPVHEFHYSKAQRGDKAKMSKSTGRNWQGLYVEGNLLSGYPHFYLHNCKDVAEAFVDLCAEHMEDKES